MRRMLVLVFMLSLLCQLASAAEIAGVLIAPEVEAPYERAQMYGDWRDDDQDCQDTRAEVLIAESLIPAVMSLSGCAVVAGLWYDPYTRRTFAVARELDIDHLVPLKEAHQSGAFAWENEKRRRYANDLDNPGHLIAVAAGANRSKADRDPAEWLPPNVDFRCAYVTAWLAVKRKWGLTADQAEADAITATLANCPSP